MKSTYSVAEVVATPTNRQSEAKAKKTIDNSTIVDRALYDTADLIETDYKKWFAKQVIQLGAARYLGIAKEAREGKHPKRLFVWLLKRA